MVSVTVASNNFVSKICLLLLFFQKRCPADMKITSAPLKWTEKKHPGPKFFIDEPGEIPYPGEFSPYSGEITYVSN